MTSTTCRVTIQPTDRIATIQPNLYGHFSEHLGRCIYDGIWVGENPSISNISGFRTDLLQALRKMKPPVIRWPGGCFADDYHWQDGIGPREDRPRRINIHWGEVIETNEVGTHEFIQFCRLVGAEPYICGNVGSGTVRELRDWVEYCNFNRDSSLAAQRARNGSPDPFNVRYWGIGNENWGCGGSFSPEDYGSEYKRYASFVRGFGHDLFLIACGPSNNDVEWTQRFFRKLKNDFWGFKNIHGFAAHYYCGTAGTATEFTVDQWYQLLDKALLMEPLIVQQRATMDVFDPDRSIGLIVDEWGTWHPVEEGTNPAFLYQQNTIRDALVAATTLDIFNRHADKVVMANIAQTVNVLQAVILTEGERILVTPTGYVYEMYAPHQGKQSVRILFETPHVSYSSDNVDASSGEAGTEIPILSGSASIEGNNLFISLTNSHADEVVEVAVEILGISEAVPSAGLVLSGEIHAHNSFQSPATVQPHELACHVSGNILHMDLPAASVATLSINLT